MKPLMALRLACMLSAAGVIAALAGCASTAPATTAQADTPVQRTATTTSSATGVSPQSSGSGATPDTRDWAQVDTNRDGLVSPEEMATYLQNNPGPLKGR